MKNQTHTNLVICSSLTLALALAIWFPVSVQSAEPADGKMMMDGKMMERCQEMKAQDAELTKQVAEMNSAPMDRKMNLMAAVITHMVEQRVAMDARMAKMQDEMMQHMQMGKDSMSQCPMMKGMKNMDDKSRAGQQEQK